VTEDSKLKSVRIPCSNCGGDPKNHEVIREYSKEWEIEEAGMYGKNTHQICKCAGCDTIRFRSYSWDSEDIDWRTSEPEVREKIYPEDIKSTRQGIDVHELPEPVARIYREAVIAFNAGALILAGGGLRAVVEALCKDKNVSGRNLEKKIDRLVEQGLLAVPQAELLHEERYLGNAALHEIVAPSVLDVNDGFDIIDNLLATIYIMPDKAQRLRAKRSERSLNQQSVEQPDAEDGAADG
jgi:hypothetical protein